MQGWERLTPYQSEDPSPTIPTHRMEEEKGKTAGDIYLGYMHVLASRCNIWGTYMFWQVDVVNLSRVYVNGMEALV